MRASIGGANDKWLGRSRRTRGSSRIVRILVHGLDPIDISASQTAKSLKRALAPIVQHRESLRAFAEEQASPAVETPPNHRVSIPALDLEQVQIRDEAFEPEDIFLDENPPNEDTSNEWDCFSW
jgi:hypothetical protein